ncbi:MAG TPA: phosphate/phosphite/phosphonate ABC transporter substrate-binding protein [Anaerolineae bacterium]|nr:phosphate/phosphite/phosphonate ABC transporter substrate-binding protein [Anaerolineae bacterium]
MKNFLLLTLVLVAIMAIAACAPAVAPSNAQPTIESAQQTVAAGANAAQTAAAGAATQVAPAANTAVSGAATTVSGAATTVATAISGAATTVATVAAPQATATVPPPNCAKMDNMPTVKAGDLGSPDKPITIALVPSGDVPTITKAGTQIADCLSKLTGLTYNIEVGTNFAAAIEAMGSGHAPFGFLNTFSAILAKEKYGVTPLLVALRNYKGKPENFYQGQFITGKTTGIKSIADLKGKTFCFVDPNSTSGYIIPRIVMKANGIDPDKDLKATQNSGSHDNVAIAVYKGDCDAGATFVDVRTDSAPIKQNYPDMVDKVDVFYITDNIPNDGLQVAKGVDPALTDATVNGLLFISNDPGGKAMLRSLYSYLGLEKVDPNFYDSFEALLQKAGVNPAELVK